MAAPPAPQKSVVVIDDDPDVTFVLCTALEDDGYRVVCYTQASLALESVVADQPDLVILDWWLPESGGQTLLSALRDDPRTTNVPVLVCTADTTVLDCRDALARNGADILLKPFELDCLVAKVERLTGLNRSPEQSVIA
jgi:DNA-binding response OmpR family regulator